MSMPKGKKVKCGYATVSDDDDCADYRLIGRKMTARGHKMNHASARNYVLRAMKKFARAIANEEGKHLDEKELAEIARNPSFQSALGDILRDELDSEEGRKC